jgi:hypothetical protein
MCVTHIHTHYILTSVRGHWLLMYWHAHVLKVTGAQVALK